MTSAKGTVLIVDDEPAIRRALGGTLALLGYSAHEASSGEQGVDMARRQHYDAIVLDVNMPGLGGIEACRRLRGALPEVGILLMSAGGAETATVEAREAGADNWLSKPFAMRDLTAWLRLSIGDRRPAPPASGPISG